MKKSYLIAVVVIVLALAAWWWFGRAPQTQAPTNETSESPENVSKTDSTAAINAELESNDMGDVEAEFKTVDEDAKSL